MNSVAAPIASPLGAGSSDSDWVAAYEALRGTVLERADGRAWRAPGLALLLRSGVAGWMQTCLRAVGPLPVIRPASETAASLPGEVRAEVAGLLAEMALAAAVGDADMTNDAHQKVTPRHLRRHAYLYVRQSTLRQVLEHTESTARQYALRQRAAALGWAQEQVIVIDSDQGQSGASTAGRDGFQRSWPMSGWAAPGSSWGSKSRGWRATRPTGTGCWRSAR